MSKECTNQGRIFPDILELFVDALLHGLAGLERISCYAGSLFMTPYQFVGVDFGRVAGKEMERQFSVKRLHVFLYHRVLVCRQTVDNQVQLFFAPVHQLLEQFHKRFAIETALVSRIPECTFGVDGGRRTETLPLSWPLNNRRLSALGPGLSVHEIGAKGGLVPKIYFRVLQLLVNRGAIHPIAGNHITRVVSFPYTFNGHQPYCLLRFSINFPAISFHRIYTHGNGIIVPKMATYFLTYE